MSKCLMQTVFQYCFLRFSMLVLWRSILVLSRLYFCPATGVPPCMRVTADISLHDQVRCHIYISMHRGYYFFKESGFLGCCISDKSAGCFEDFCGFGAGLYYIASDRQYSRVCTYNSVRPRYWSLVFRRPHTLQSGRAWSALEFSLKTSTELQYGYR